MLLGDLGMYEISPKDHVKIYPVAYGGGSGGGVAKIVVGVVLIIIGILTFAYGGGF